MTISLWLNATTTNTVSYFGCVKSDQTDGIANFRIVGGKITVNNYHAGASYDIGNTTLVPNTWYHVVNVINRATTNRSLYINGVLDASDARIGTGQFSTFTYWNVGGYRTFNGTIVGKIDDVRFYNRALSRREIAALYYSRRPTQ